MDQKSRHIIRLVTIKAALCLLFSISSFADGYSFQNDGDQQNQRFSGTNKVYTDGIYVGEMGAIDAYMDNYGNTYNGTNLIDATAYPGAGQDDESTYNGTLSVTANDIVSSKTIIDDATVNASTNVNVNEVLSDNNLNAGVQFNNSNFNNDVTLSGSGAVNLEGSTVNNLVLGNIPQMETLLNYQQSIKNLLDTVVVHLRALFYLLCSDNSAYDTSDYPTLNYSFVSGNASISGSYPRFACWIVSDVNWNRSRQYMRGSYVRIFAQSMDWIILSMSNSIAGLRNTIDSFHNDFTAWYYPLTAIGNPQYWKAYNTDTGQYDDVNLATVFMYITWYLGKIYDDSSNVTQQMHQMTQDIGTAATTFQDLNQKEQTAIDQISQGFETFLPDVNQFSSFRAISWCSNYLQQIYLALGSYGTVIFIALLFGVCLQFIGYFRYK